MDEVEFDKFADEYRDLHAANIKLSGEDPEYFAEYKVVDIATELAREHSVARTALGEPSTGSSTLSAVSDSGFVSVGRSGSGTLAVADHSTLAATIVNVGRATGGVGFLSVDNSIVNLSGQQTTVNAFGAALSIGNRGGTGGASISNSSIVNISNMGSNGASLNVGGTSVNPLGNGTLTASGNSAINITAAPGLAVARIGHDGDGSATFNASSLNLSDGTTRDGSVIIAGQTGSTGLLSLNAGSVVNAAYVGVGATQSAVVNVQNDAGAGHLVINNSTVNTTTFEIGKHGILSGDGGIINATGDVIVGGTIDPGNSPGRIRINCNLVSLSGSQLILDIAYDGTSYVTDQLIIGSESTFHLQDLQIVFNFLGDADPTDFADRGLLNLDTFLRAGDSEHPDDLSGVNLSNLFGDSIHADLNRWSDVIGSQSITAVSSSFDITALQFNEDGSFAVSVNAVPEPPTWVLMLLGLLIMAACTRRYSVRDPRTQWVKLSFCNPK